MNWIFDWIFDWIDDHLGLVTILVGGALAICIGLMVWASHHRDAAAMDLSEVWLRDH